MVKVDIDAVLVDDVDGTDELLCSVLNRSVVVVDVVVVVEPDSVVASDVKDPMVEVVVALVELVVMDEVDEANIVVSPVVNVSVVVVVVVVVVEVAAVVFMRTAVVSLVTD